MEGEAVPLWAIAVILGPIILGAALAYGIWHNRRKRRDIEAARRHERLTRPERSR